MNVETTVVEAERPVRAVSWTAILAGTLAGLVTQLVLTVLGMAIGIIALDGDGPDSLAGFAIGAAVWFIASLAISAYVGGLMAAGAARNFTPEGGRFNGLLTGMLLLLVLNLFTVNIFFAGLNQVMGIARTAVVAGSNVAADVADQVNVPAQDVRAQAEQAVRALTQEPGQISREAAAAAGRTAWSWLLVAGLILGFATLGGHQGSHTRGERPVAAVHRSRAATPGV